MRVHNESTVSYLRCLSVKITIFAVICIFGGLIVGQVRTQDFFHSDDVVFPGPDNSKTEKSPSRKAAVENTVVNRLIALEPAEFNRWIHRSRGTRTNGSIRCYSLANRIATSRRKSDAGVKKWSDDRGIGYLVREIEISARSSFYYRQLEIFPHWLYIARRND